MTTTAPEQQIESPTHRIDSMSGIRLGGDEFAIRGQIGLASTETEYDPAVNLVILDVGFRQGADGYGPYDIDGSGEKRTFSKPYLLVSRVGEGEEAKTVYYEYDPEKDGPLELGRTGPVAEALGYQQNKSVSRKHAVMSIEGGYDLIKVQDEGSLNGTTTRSAKEVLGDTSTDYGYTINIADYISRAGRGHHYTGKHEAVGRGHGEYGGRPIIARDTRINEGVYPVGGTHGEAIVVDDKKYPALLDRAYQTVVERLSHVGPAKIAISGLINRVKNRGEKLTAADTSLATVFKYVEETLRYDQAATDALARDSQKISIDVYMSEGVGVCRTQAVLCAYLVERLIDQGKLDGRISIDRNMDRSIDGGGHAWARFTAPDGTVYIMDPAQHFVGTLEEAQKNGKRWDYRRSEDMMRELLAA